MIIFGDIAQKLHLKPFCDLKRAQFDVKSSVIFEYASPRSEIILKTGIFMPQNGQFWDQNLNLSNFLYRHLILRKKTHDIC